MEEHLVRLSAEEFGRLNSLYPASDGSARIGKRAEAVVKIHLRRRDPQCAFEIPNSGADLKVVLSDCAEPLLIEIKGTSSAGIAWQQLKVSSRHSWRSITEACIPVYRVSEVFSEAPTIYVLTHNADFTLEQEDRWTFKPARKQSAPPLLLDRDPVTKRRSEPLVSRRSKYDALRYFLEEQTADQVTVTFAEAAKILGFQLPPSASKHQAFWANQTRTASRPWARAWQQAGFEVDSFHLSPRDGWTKFKRRLSARS
jgi:hypothetical protein